MKEFLQTLVVAVAVLAMFIGARVALFAPLHNEMIGMTNPAPTTVADSGCGVMAIKMPCFRHANPQGRATTSASVQNGPAVEEANAVRDPRCGPRQVKFPCLQHADERS